MNVGEWQLGRYWTVIKKRIWWAIGVPIVSTLTGVILCFYVLTPQYEADTTLLIGTQQASNPAAQYESIMANQALVKTYTDIIRSKVIEQAVIHKLGLTLTPQQLSKTIHVISPDQSQIIQISVIAPNPRFTVDVANALGQVFQQQSKSLNIQTIHILDKATLAKHPVPVKPNTHLDLTLAVAIGLVLGIAIVFLLETLDTRFKTAEDVYAYLDLPLLGSVAEFKQ